MTDGSWEDTPDSHVSMDISGGRESYRKSGQYIEIVSDVSIKGWEVRAEGTPMQEEDGLFVTLLEALLRVLLNRHVINLQQVWFLRFVNGHSVCPL